MKSFVTFWTVLAVLSLFILASPGDRQPVFRQGARTGYRITFDRMRLHDVGEDSTTLIYAKKATYDRRRAQVSLVSPVIIVQATSGKELWRAIAGWGVADVVRRSDLFPSTLGDMRLTNDVVIKDLVGARVLSTSGMVWYLASDEVLLSTYWTRIQMPFSVAQAPGFLLGNVDGKHILVQGGSVSDMIKKYRTLRDLRRSESVKGGTRK